MTTHFTPHRFPTVALSQRQIVYVTDNDRDAEALSCEMECPVVTDPRFDLAMISHPAVILRQTPRTLRASHTPRASQTSGIPKTPRTSETLGTPETLGTSEASGGSETSQTSETFPV